MKTFRKTIGALVVAGAALATATPANAAPPAGSNQGTDHVRSTGSDTTYDMMVRLNTIYNGSVGCSLKLTAPELGSNCVTPLAGVETENYDHDTMVEEYPVGSGNGRIKLRTAPNDGPLVSSRSSDALPTAANNTTKDNGLSGSSYAKDGLTVVVFLGTKNGVPGTNIANPNSVSLTKSQVEAIFSGEGSLGAGVCATDWSQLGNPGGLTGAITTYGVQTGSGTYKSMDNLLAGNPNTCATRAGLVAPGAGGGAGCAGAGTCTNTRILFENNMAPIDGGAGTDGVSYATVNDRSSAVFWMSNGARLTDAVSTGTAKYVQVDNSAPTTANISNNSYPLTRDLWHVNRKIDVSYSAPLGSPSPTAATVAPVGISGNPGYLSTAGAAYNYREWLCRNGGHAATPKVYNTEITNAIQAAGFVRRTNTELNPVTGATERCIHENFVGNGASDTKVIPANWKTA